MEETQEPLNNVLYVFGMEAAALFTAALMQIPTDEIGRYSVWNALKVKEKIFESEENGKIYRYETVWCLLTDFRDEHAHLRANAEANSLFYAPDNLSDRTLINEFFNAVPEDYSESLQSYMQSIGKNGSI
jgi:hypothetical protein